MILPNELLQRIEKAEAENARLRAILMAIIYASDGCRGHAGCSHSMQPWRDAREELNLLRTLPWHTGMPIAGRVKCSDCDDGRVHSHNDTCWTCDGSGWLVKV